MTAPENSATHIRRLQAERETCIKMAGNYRTSFQHSIILFRRADRLESEMLDEVKKNAVHSG